MNYNKYLKFLWILLAVLLIGILAVALIDGTKRSQQLSSPAISANPAEKTPAPNTKVGFKIGDEAPDFQLTTIDNKDIKLSDYRGKNIVLNFWATWCGPCRFETPFLQSLQSTSNDSDIILIAVSTQDTMENTITYALKNNLDFMIPVDPRGVVAASYNIHGIPTSFFIDKTGIIKNIKIGPFVNEDELAEKVTSAFK